MPEILKKLYTMTANNKYIRVRLSDKKIIECTVDCLTYANKSDEDDTDEPVALVILRDGREMLLSENDILEIIA